LIQFNLVHYRLIPTPNCGIQRAAEDNHAWKIDNYPSNFNLSFLNDKARLFWPFWTRVKLHCYRGSDRKNLSPRADLPQCVAGMNDPAKDQNGGSVRRRYKWPWFVLAAFVVAVLLAMLWLSFEIERTQRIRDANAPAKQ